jgi:hypothetical protein
MHLSPADNGFILELTSEFFTKERVDEEEAQRATYMLKHIKPRDDYGDWLNIGMALHSVDESLLYEWITHSQGSSNFDEKECIDKWASFKGSGVTLGTLYYMAKLDTNNQVDFKWSPPEIVSSSNEASDANDDLSIEDSLKGLIELYAQSKIEAQALLPEFLSTTTIACVNVCHLSNKIAELCARLEQLRADVVILTETWLDASREHVVVPGYDFAARLDRVGREGGGV